MDLSTAGGIVAHATTGTLVEDNHGMHMAIKSQRWTRGDLERLPHDTNKYEVVHGELLVSPLHFPAHEYIKRALARRLAAFCEPLGLAQVFEESGFAIGESATIPDIIVREPVWPPPRRWDDMPLPMLVAEVLSESTRRNDLVKKRGFYIESGIPEYWIVDGEARMITVVKPGEADRMFDGTLVWRLPLAAEPFELDVNALFRDALGAIG